MTVANFRSYSAAFYHVYDLKILFICSVILFEVGSVLCGAAPSMNALIIGRVLAGVGGSGVYIGYVNFVLLLTSGKEDFSYSFSEFSITSPYPPRTKNAADTFQALDSSGVQGQF